MFNTKYRYSLEGQEINSFTFKQDNLVNVPIKCKYSKLSLIQGIYNISYSCFSCKIIVNLIAPNLKPEDSSNSILTAS